MKYFNENISNIISDDPTFLCNSFAKKGCLKGLIYLHENGYQWDETTINVILMEGHIDCLKYAHNNKCYWNKKESIDIALQNGNLKCMKYAYENDCPCIGKELYISKKINIECLKYALDIGYTLNKNNACCTFASLGKPDCLEYVHSKGCVLDEDVLYSLSEQIYFTGNHKKCFMYAMNNGCLKYAEESVNSKNSSLCTDAAENANIGFLNCSKQFGFYIDFETVKEAIQAESMPCLKFCIENGCPCDIPKILDDYYLDYSCEDYLKSLL